MFENLLYIWKYIVYFTHKHDKDYAMQTLGKHTIWMVK